MRLIIFLLFIGNPGVAMQLSKEMSFLEKLSLLDAMGMGNLKIKDDTVKFPDYFNSTVSYLRNKKTLLTYFEAIAQHGKNIPLSQLLHEKTQAYSQLINFAHNHPNFKNPNPDLELVKEAEAKFAQSLACEIALLEYNGSTEWQRFIRALITLT